jgi:NADPH-dependent ferric siderophore reductase
MSIAQLPASPARAPGRLGRTLIRLMMKHARVAANEALGDRYRLVTLEGPDLRGVQWIAGEFIQLAMGSAFRARAYTPIDWDAAAGRMRLLGYLHGGGPGSAWVGGVRPGEECDFFGPRRSLDVRHIAGPIVFCGDETAIGLAHALIHENPSRRVTCHFEVDDLADGRAAAAGLGIGAATTFSARQPGEGHLAALEESLAEAGNAHFVLAGKVGTVQRLRQTLRQRGVTSARILPKAYWAPGKAGLD